MEVEKLGEALQLLRAQGFTPTGFYAGQRHFEGSLPCTKGGVSVRLSIDDWNFLSYPKIKILKHPTFLPELMPHVDVAGELCYFSPGSVVLDRYDPATAILQCLNQATALLDRIASDPNYISDDIQDEFQAHWEFGQKKMPWQVLLGKIEPDAKYAHYTFIGEANSRRTVIASHADDVAILAAALGAGKPKETKCRCWLLKTEQRPAVPHTMPQTIKELFIWLKLWDASISNKIQNILEKDSSYLAFSFISFAIDTPIGWIGFVFDLYAVPHLNIKGIPKKIRPQAYKQYLHGSGGKKEFLRLSITEVSGDFVHSRNLIFQDLRDKNINLIGCGSIGSYLAQALTRLGAGTGSGSLNLIDPDTLSSENLGRHLLGYPSLFQPKAKALSEELTRQFPFSNIQPIPKSAFEYPKLFTADLVIDATGEEAVSEYLNGLRLDRGIKKPVLHIWIKGNGDCVQALWADDSGGGCYRCLKSTDPQYYRLDRFPVLNNAPERRFRGCQSYTPYAVAAPMQAAALASDMVAAWMQGDSSPKFRTRSVENADVRKVKNQNISQLKGCPACDRH